MALFIVLAVSFHLPALASPVGSEVARGIAQAWMSAHVSVSAAGGKGLHAVKGVRPFVGYSGELIAHIVDLSPEGFIIVPADDGVEPILAYGLEGDFSGRLGPNEPLSDILARDIPSRLRRLGAGSSQYRQKIHDRWSCLKAAAFGNTSVNSGAIAPVTPVVTPLVTSIWSQGDPYSYYTPNHYVTGCVATATGMLVDYYRFPRSASGSNTVWVDNQNRTASFNDKFNYGLMPDSIDLASPLPQIQEVAKLLYDCGIAVGMSYTSSASGASSSNIGTALQDFFHYQGVQYKSGYDSDWADVLKEQLCLNRPAELVIIAAEGPAHAIVCDGWVIEDGTDRFHLNMGWGGYDNSWYAVPGFSAGGYTWDALYGYYHGAYPGVPTSPAVIHVKPGGSDGNDGLTWEKAKGTVQAALDAAAFGDEIWVAAGTYAENLVFHTTVGLYGGFSGAEATRTARNPKANATVLDGAKLDSVVTLVVPECPDLHPVIDGFTIRNGAGKIIEACRYGGGIYAVGCSPVISNNTITNNSVYPPDYDLTAALACASGDRGAASITEYEYLDCYGGGIYCRGGSPSITNNNIAQNGTFRGGGICCFDSSPTITGNTVASNYAIFANSTGAEGSGGGIFTSGGSPVIKGNTVSRNTCADYGGGICCFDSSAAVSSNVVTDNTAFVDHFRDNTLGFGGGIYYGGSGSVSSNKLSGNYAKFYGGGIDCAGSAVVASNLVTHNSGGYGGGICAEESVLVVGNTISDCQAVVADNGEGTTVGGDGGGLGISGDPTVANNIVAFCDSGIFKMNDEGSPMLRKNCVSSNARYDYQGLASGEGDISKDPLFAGRSANNYHLQSGSPCADAGDDSAVEDGWLDVDGEARLFGSHTDIGADELTPSKPYDVSLRPSSGVLVVGAKTTFTTVHGDYKGFAHLSGCLLLINSSLTGANATYAYYNANSGKLYVRRDDNTGWMGGFAPGSANVIENSCCRLYCAESSVSSSGNDLTVNWRIELKPAMSAKGTCPAWMLTVDDPGVGSGWSQKGSFSIDRPPSAVSVLPNKGILPVGAKQAFASVYSDPDGYKNLWGCCLLINSTFTGANATYAYYNANANKLYVRSDTNTGWVGGFAPGSANVIENSCCRLYCAETTTSSSGNNLAVNWRIELKPAMSAKGTCPVWMLATDDANSSSGWSQKGSFSIDRPPSAVSVSPNSGTLPVGVKKSFASVYSDPDGYQNLWGCCLLINSSLTGVNASYAYYNANSGKLYVRRDDNTGWMGGFAPGSANVIENSCCRLYCAESSVSSSGSNLTVNWRLELKAAMSAKGSCPVWMLATDDANSSSGWAKKGSFTSIR